MPTFKISEIWMLTKNGKIIARPDRKCPKCYEVGKIVGDSPFDKNLGITRKCLNKDCDSDGERWNYYKSWDDYTIRELEEYKEWLGENVGSRPEFASKKVNEVLESKKKKQEEK